MASNTVLPNAQLATEDDFHACMMLGIARMVAKHGRGKVANALGVSTRQLGNLANGSFPAPHRLFNLLVLDPTALNEVSGLYGAELRASKPNAANDMETVAGLSHLAGKWVEALSDGNRCHRETLDLADTIRPIVASLNAICLEADRIKGAA